MLQLVMVNDARQIISHAQARDAHDKVASGRADRGHDVMSMIARDEFALTNFCSSDGHICDRILR